MSIKRRKQITKTEIIKEELTNAVLAKLAVNQNEQDLRVKFPNIVSVSDAVHDLAQQESHVVAIYLNDNNSFGIPDKLEVKIPDGRIKTIGTEIVKNVGVGEVYFSQKDYVQTDGECFSGSICCMVNVPNNGIALVTSGHIYSNCNLINYGGWLYEDKRKKVMLNGVEEIGDWIFQQISNTQDIGLIKLNNTNRINEFVKFKEKGFYQITDNDVKKEIVTLLSNKSNTRDGIIIDYNTVWSIKYKDNTQLKSNIIVIGTNINKSISKSISQKGDSGGLVYHKNTGKLVGLILGGNDKFTWVLPIKETLEHFNISLI